MRTRFERFCLRHRNKGIPNLMMYIAIGCGIVAIMNMLGYSQVYSLLTFNRSLILKGQVWRLLSWPLIEGSGNIFLTLILLYCYYSLGRAVESAWGTFRFNLFYLGNILLMDLFAMIFADMGIHIAEANTNFVFTQFYASSMGSYLHLTLLLAFATLYPDAQFTIFFVIPIKAWVLSILYFIIIIVDILSLSIPHFYFPHNLFPLVAMANYFLFFGKDVVNLLPLSWRVRRKGPKKQYAPQKPIPFDKPAKKEESKAPYMHRCTICGRTDISNPELEFRYCSRCNGYFCYCQDHISNHTHIE